MEQSEEALAIATGIRPDMVPPEWRSENAVLCVASRTALDETPALVLAQLLQKCGVGAKVLGPSETKHGALQRQDLEGVQLICISALDVSERSAHVRFLARRLKRSAPDALLLGAFWKLDPDTARAKEIIGTVTIDRIVHSLKDALAFCLQSATLSPGERSGDRTASAAQTFSPALAE